MLRTERLDFSGGGETTTALCLNHRVKNHRWSPVWLQSAWGSLPPSRLQNRACALPPHTAPQGYAPGQGHPGGLVIGTFAPPPHGPSRHRARARSRLLQRDSSRSLADPRPPVSIATGSPRGLGCLGPPPTGPYPGDPCAPARLSSSRWLPPSPGPGGRAVMNHPTCAHEHDPGILRSSSPCAADGRPPRVAGCLGRVSQSAADPLRP